MADEHLLLPRLSPQQIANALLRAHDNGPWLIPPWARFGWGGRPRRAIDFAAECGYPDEGELDATWFKQAYTRWGIAARYVDIWPDECWSVFPVIRASDAPGEDEFKDRFDELNRKTLLDHYVHRADRLSGIGQYGIIFLGLDDGGRLDRPPEGIDPDTGQKKKGAKPGKPLGLNYVRAFDQTLVRVSGTEKVVTNPRYGQPKYYNIQFAATATSGVGPGPSVPGPTLVENKVHWTRVIHLADNRRSSEIYGMPRLIQIANHLHDMRKVVGGSAEMFWRGGFPGYAFETYPDLAGDAIQDPEELTEQIESYARGMTRYLATVGGKWNSLQPQVANPANHLEWYVKLICATAGIPVKIFLGSESGHLASIKDDEAWRIRCHGRQTRYLEPMVLRPLIDRLIGFGVLPDPGQKSYTVNWRDLQTLSDKDRVDVSLKKIQALQTFYAANVDQKFPTRLMLTLLMGFTESQADAIEAELEKNPPDPPAEHELELAKIAAKPNPGGARNGTAPKGPVGRPKGAVEGSPKPATKPGTAGRRAALHANRRAEVVA